MFKTVLLLTGFEDVEGGKWAMPLLLIPILWTQIKAKKPFKLENPYKIEYIEPDLTHNGLNFLTLRELFFNNS